MKAHNISINDEHGNNKFMRMITTSYKTMMNKIDHQMVEKLTLNILKTKRQELPFFSRVYIYINKKFIN
jgi:hypothetical protein